MALMVKEPQITLLYEGQAFSAQLAPFVGSLTYVDHLGGEEPDAIEVELQDRQRLFQGPLYPRRGAALAFAFGFGPDDPFESGQGFEIDEIEVNGPPDTVRMRALGNVPSSRMHDRVSYAWKGVTLEQIARSIAARHGLAVTVDADIQLGRITQTDESDLAFLKRLAKDYGLVCSLKGNGKSEPAALVILKAEALEQRAPVYILGRSSLTRWRFRDKITPGSRGSYTRYFDSELKELVEFEVKVDPDQVWDGLLKRKVPGLWGRSQQVRTLHRAPRPSLQVHAKRALRSSKSFEHEATLTMPGQVRIRAGVTVELPVDGVDGWGALGGRYLVYHSRHRLEVQGGYTTECTVRKVLA